jgi:hypothetical protein
MNSSPNSKRRKTNNTRRRVQLPRNYENNVMKIPLNANEVVHFREGQSNRYVAKNTFNMMKTKNGVYVSPLSRQPVHSYTVVHVNYVNKPNRDLAKEANNKKKIENLAREKGKQIQNRLNAKTNKISKNVAGTFSLANLERNQRIRGSLRAAQAQNRLRRHQEAVNREQARRNQVRQNAANRLRRQVHNYTPQHLTRNQVNFISGRIGQNYSSQNLQNRRNFTNLEKNMIRNYVFRAHNRSNIPRLTVINKALRHLNRVRNQRIENQLVEATRMWMAGSTREEKNKGQRQYIQLKKNIDVRSK